MNSLDQTASVTELVSFNWRTVISLVRVKASAALRPNLWSGWVAMPSLSISTRSR